MAYVQYLDAYGEWQITARMSVGQADIIAAHMLPEQAAFVRRCGPL